MIETPLASRISAPGTDPGTAPGTGPGQDAYRVTLDAFEGPLDLLLYLIRRAEIDVTEIAVASITDQYLAFLRRVENIDVELAGDFLVMAATLVEVKSRTLMPPEAAPETGGAGSGPEAPGEDPRHTLIRQLLAYQRVRDAGEQLAERRASFAQRWPRRPARAAGAAGAGGQEESRYVELELEDAHVMDLADAYERLTSAIDFERLGDHVVEIDDTPIILHQEDLLDRLRHAADGRVSLQDTFDGRSPIQRVGLFLATLELARQRRISVLQREIDDEIEIALRDHDEGDDEDDGELQSEG